MTNNYLKIQKRIDKKGEYVEPEQYVFFNDRDPDSRRDAWLRTTAECSDVGRISIFRGAVERDLFGNRLFVVNEELSPISGRVEVIGT